MALTIQDFVRFDTENPAVYRIFERFAMEAHRTGRAVGAKMIWERIRWYAHVETQGDCFKLNNNYTAFYARKFMVAHPETADMFETRESVADEEEPASREAVAKESAAPVLDCEPDTGRRPSPPPEHMVEPGGQVLLYDPRSAR